MLGVVPEAYSYHMYNIIMYIIFLGAGSYNSFEKALAAQTRCHGFNFRLYFSLFLLVQLKMHYALWTYLKYIKNNYSTHNLDIDDLFDVQSELNPVASNWKRIGLALRLKHDALENIQAANPGNPTACLTVTLKEWFNKAYNIKKFGEPTWQHLVEAVSHPVGGANVALATKIAENHKAKGM